MISTENNCLAQRELYWLHTSFTTAVTAFTAALNSACWFTTSCPLAKPLTLRVEFYPDDTWLLNWRWLLFFKAGLWTQGYRILSVCSRPTWVRQAKEQSHETMRYHVMYTTSRTKRDTGIPMSAGVFCLFEERKPQEGECSDAGDKSY